MTGFGRALRAERERCGLALEVISSQTKVAVRHLEAVEAEDFGSLPGGVFRKGIVRAYVASLGLDDTVWMERYQASHQAFAHATGAPLEPEPEAWEAFAENVKRSRPKERRSLDLRWLGLLGLILLLIAAAWAAWHYVLESRLSNP